MKNFLFITTALVLFNSIGNSQIIEGLPINEGLLPSTQFIDFPHLNIKNYGIGNYGFDSNFGFYNPKYIKNHSRFIINLASSINFFSRDYIYQGEITSISETKHVLIPDFQIGYFSKDIFLQLIYKSDMYQNISFTKYSLFNFFTSRGEYMYRFKQRTISKNEILQAASSFNIGGKASISFGFLSNHFKQELNGNEYDFSIHLERKFFDQFQVLASFNYNYKDGAFYIFGKTQNQVLTLNYKENGIPGDIIWPYKPKISYPGLLAYGFQYKYTEYVNLSLELVHEILNYKNKIVKDIKQNKNIFNTEIILGSNVQFLSKFEAGLLISYFLKYDNKIGLQWTGFNYRSKIVKLNNPLMAQLSLNYSHNQLSFSLWYQYSFANYEYSEEWYIRDSAQFLTLGIGIEL